MECLQFPQRENCELFVRSTKCLQPRTLSRLLITGPIDENVPLCVLTEIADAHGIDHGDLSNVNLSVDDHINGFTRYDYIYNLVQDIFEVEVVASEEAEYLARFVNKNSQWNLESLLQSFNFLYSFVEYEDDPLNLVPKSFEIGCQTPQNTKSINACLLYKICCYHRLNINSRTTIQQMAHAVRLLRADGNYIKHRALNFIENSASRSQLINIMLMSGDVDDCRENNTLENNSADQINIDNSQYYFQLKDIYQPLSDVTILRNHISPVTNAGAIALAALNFYIDISKSADPVSEYKNLRLSGRSKYIPDDPWLKSWYMKNRSIFDLKITFNPTFPQQYYDKNDLRNMAICEGHDVIYDPYELMQLSYVSDTFYLGIRPEVTGTSPIELYEIDEIHPDELLCYGTRTNLKPISMSELLNCLEINLNFSSPFAHNSVFSDTSIKKLKKLLVDYASTSSDMMSLAQRLHDIISKVQSMCIFNDEATKKLRFNYRIVDNETKKCIMTCLYNLLQVGMYMRGWKGDGYPYPVDEAIVPPDRIGEVDINVTHSIEKYNKSVRLLGKMGYDIDNLPLVLYNDGHYQLSTRPSQGFTIRDRLTIVKEGENTDNIESCIRMSSNWICSTAHKYITALEGSPPFEVHRLRLIR